MKGILPDHDVEGLVAILIGILRQKPWLEFWLSLHLEECTFAGVGLDPKETDLTIWTLCQERELVLVMGNRNSDSNDSLEATIRALNAAQSLPVLTIADVNRIGRSPQYAHRTAERMLDYLLKIDELRGTGRLHIP